MKFIDFKQHFESFKVFSIQDIVKWDSGFDNRRLVEWQEKQYITKVVNRWYVFNQRFDLRSLYLVSNRIYAPSYVSFESALAHYGVIPEGVYSITAATSRKTQQYQTPIGNFVYKHLKPELMFGYTLLQTDGHYYKLAQPEKVLLDYFYLNSNIDSPEAIEALRFNVPQLNALINKQRLADYLSLMDNKQLVIRMKLFMKTVMNYAEHK